MARSDNTRVPLTASRRCLLNKLDLIKKQDNEIKKQKKQQVGDYHLLSTTTIYYHLLSATIIYSLLLLSTIATFF
ncbi:hypothetical protein M431DRAFT_508548 [Trichoderma harzianum CBS 226.95]|uniref:Uncharacterized protein n=1 Tax=Trichoderma harzianum CBS 226.95 TaxID=983964 RepID=A0A2T4ADJ1_TRIHA|nr:hypothetical protein M431DRAFT_508548 [Trichoderma harzianum CBS 226.95]PTB55139.1 hypothetical protein M431DRAFT_508548 [Trichoderma harzianum CBS 226.95]